jgi:hypothetical protein
MLELAAKSKKVTSALREGANEQMLPSGTPEPFTPADDRFGSNPGRFNRGRVRRLGCLATFYTGG